MNKKKILAQLTILSMLFIGCSNMSIEKNTSAAPEQSTIEQTMTKIQNDASEIINKDYDYVLSNLGEANVTTYWADIKNLKTIETVEDAKKMSNIDLFYFKNVEDEEEQNTALYLRLHDRVVKNVSSIDYSKPELVDSIYESKVVFSIYEDYDQLDLNTVKTMKLKEFEGLKYDECEALIGSSQYIYDAYVYDETGRGVEIFQIKGSEDKLCIFTKDDIVTKVKMINPEDAYDVKKLLLEDYDN